MQQERFSLPGYPLPLGFLRLDGRGAQFSILSRHATSVTLVLYQSTDPDSQFEEIMLDPIINKTGDIWHIWIGGIKHGQLYAYRMDGMYAPELGHRYNKNKLLLDPYTRAVTGNFKWDLSDARGFDPTSQFKDAVYSPQDSAPGAPKCIVIDHDFDWFDRPINKKFHETIIYEMHVKGFTYHESSGVEPSHRGTYRGVVEKIPHLKELGISAVELMPIQEFDDEENINRNPFTRRTSQKTTGGYSTFSFFAPKIKFLVQRQYG